MATATNQSAKDKGHGAVEKAGDLAHKATEKATDFAHRATEAAGDVAQKATEKAGQVASAVADKADSAVESVGSGLQSAGGALRENLPNKGVVGGATDTVAGALESGGKYLEEKGLSGISEDVTDLIKRNPIPAVLLALGLGYLIASATRSS